MKKPNDRTKQLYPSGSLGRCRVCMKAIGANEDYIRAFHGGDYYLVCCASCAAKFEANPASYLVD